MDPAGIPWERFHTLNDIPSLSETPKASVCGGTPSAIKMTTSGCFV